MLADQHNPVVEFLTEVVVGRCIGPLDELRTRVDVIDGKRAAGVVPVPDHHETRPGFEHSSDGGIHFASKKVATLLIATLAGQQLLVSVVDAAHAFHIRHYKNLGALRRTNAHGQYEQCRSIHSWGTIVAKLSLPHGIARGLLSRVVLAAHCRRRFLLTRVSFLASSPCSSSLHRLGALARSRPR